MEQLNKFNLNFNKWWGWIEKSLEQCCNKWRDNILPFQPVQDLGSLLAYFFLSPVYNESFLFTTKLDPFFTQSGNMNIALSWPTWSFSADYWLEAEVVLLFVPFMTTILAEPSSFMFNFLLPQLCNISIICSMVLSLLPEVMHWAGSSHLS